MEGCLIDLFELCLIRRVVTLIVDIHVLKLERCVQLKLITTRQEVCQVIIYLQKYTKKPEGHCQKVNCTNKTLGVQATGGLSPVLECA